MDFGYGLVVRREGSVVHDAKAYSDRDMFYRAVIDIRENLFCLPLHFLYCKSSLFNCINAS